MKTGNNRLNTLTPNWAVSLRIYRKTFGYTQATFGAKFGVSAMAVSYWEAGKIEPPLDVVLWIIRVAAETQKLAQPEMYGSLLLCLHTLTSEDVEV